MTDYAEFKLILDRGKHPAFIGRGTFERNASNGGALFYAVDGEAIGVSLINPHLGILLALNVMPAHRGNGVGRAIVEFLVPNFVRCTEERIGFFEALGYRKIGRLKKGITLRTQVMARAALFELAGRLRRTWAYE